MAQEQNDREANRILNEENRRRYNTVTTYLGELTNELQQLRQIINQMEQQSIMRILELQENNWSEFTRITQEAGERRREQQETIKN
jgi:hypothetical protein